MASRERIVKGAAGSLLLLCALTVALDGRPAAAEGAPRTAQVHKVFFGESEETACRPGGREFVLQDLRELHVCIVWWGLAGAYSAPLTFVAPDGHVYQKKTLAFVNAEAPATGATGEVKGRHHKGKRAGRGRNGETVVVATPAGAATYITQHNLAALWT